MGVIGSSTSYGKGYTGLKPGASAAPNSGPFGLKTTASKTPI